MFPRRADINTELTLGGLYTQPRKVPKPQDLLCQAAFDVGRACWSFP